MSLNSLRDRAFLMASAKGWHDVPRPVPESLCLIHSEVSEALEGLRAGWPVDQVFIENSKPEGIPVEMADIIIRVLDFCGEHGIDIERVVEQKMAYNATRPHRHGKKL